MLRSSNIHVEKSPEARARRCHVLITPTSLEWVTGLPWANLQLRAALSRRDPAADPAKLQTHGCALGAGETVSRTSVREGVLWREAEKLMS